MLQKSSLFCNVNLFRFQAIAPDVAKVQNPVHWTHDHDYPQLPGPCFIRVSAIRDASAYSVA